MRHVVIGEDAREGILRGLNKVANAVKVTLGPHGNVVMFNDHSGTRVTKDGVTVAEQVILEDNLENMGADIIRQTSQQTAKIAGDGTTTSMVLAQSFVRQALIAIRGGYKPTVIKKEMQEAVDKVIGKLEETSLPVSDYKTILHVATISSNNSPYLGKLIADAFESVGRTGKVRIEKSHGVTHSEVIKGLQFGSGYYSPYFSTDTDTRQVIYENGVKVIVINTKLTNDAPIQRILHACERPTIIYCNEVDSSALGQIVVSKLRSSVPVCLVKSPFYAKKRQDALEDICAHTGAYLISTAEDLSQFNSKMIGSAEKGVVTKDTSLLINGSKDIQPYIDSLNDMLDDAESTHEQDRLLERISRLTTGVAVIYVGGETEVDMKERKDRVDDAVKAVEAALKNGFLPGGGTALFHIGNELLNEENTVGESVVYHCLASPILQIADNADKTSEEMEKILDKLRSLDFYSGMDFIKEEYVDMVKQGIIDPTLVVTSALKNAMSVAGMLILTKCALPTVGDREKGLPEFMKS